MSILLTGATGFIGSSVLHALLEQGREVTALVRTAEQAAEIEAAGASTAIGSIEDLALVAELAGASEGVIHAAAPSGDNAVELQQAFVDTVLGALADSGKPFIHTGGIWGYGNNDSIVEYSPLDSPRISAWRGKIEDQILGAQGIKTTVIRPGVVYGHGRGLPALISAENGVVELMGDGRQHWANVYADDLGELYILAFDMAAAGSVYIGANETNPTVRELAIAVAEGAGLDESALVVRSDEETAERFGADFAEALLLDQQSVTTSAKIDLGWEPNGPTLVDDVRSGSYRK